MGNTAGAVALILERIQMKAMSMNLGTVGLGRLMITGLIFAMAIGAALTSATGAIFTDSDAVGSNTFSSGTVILSTSPTSAVVSFSDMAPGDVDNGQMTVSNDGSLQLRYAVTTGTTEDTLAAQLDMTIWDEADEVVVDSTCLATAPATVLYGPALLLGSVAGFNLIGDPTTGPDTDDRTLAASSSEILCFRVELPLASGNAYQGITSTATLTFVSEQTANNN